MREINMNIDVLFNAYEKMVSNYTELSLDEAKGVLKQYLLKRRDFDVQDEAIIEALLRDRDRLLEQSFIEGVDEYLQKEGLDKKKIDFLKSKEGQNKVVEIFLLKKSTLFLSRPSF